MVTLSVAQASAENSVSIIIWVLVLVALLIPLAAATLWLRRWVHEDMADQTNVGFTLHDIHDMLKRGELDQAQYDRLKQEIITQAKQALEAKAKAHQPKDDKKKP